MPVSYTHLDVYKRQLLNNYDMYFDIQKDMEAKGRKMEAELNAKSSAFEKQMIDFQEKVQKGLVTRSQAQTMQQELAEKEQQLYQYRDELRMQFAEEEQVMLRRIHQSIYDYQMCIRDRYSLSPHIISRRPEIFMIGGRQFEI